MKNTFSLLFFALSIQTSFSQNISASGSVKDENGKPISAALISEFKSDPAAATYTDSLGFFSFSIKRFSKLTVSCKGYNDTLVNINDNNNISIILTKVKSAKRLNNVSDNNENPLINKNLLQDAVSTQTGVNNNYVYSGAVRNYTGSLLPVFTYKEDTKGSRYLFNEWARGSIVTANNSLFDNPAYLYNYDKMDGGLLLTHDKESAIEADRSQIKTFTVYTDENSPVIYANLPTVDASHFVQVISDGGKYKICKLTKTKFIKSNYHTDGIAATGNPYDEYVDEDTYFSINVKDNKPQKLNLKKKSLKDVFAAEGDKLDRFLSDNSNSPINENFLRRLGSYLNN